MNKINLEKLTDKQKVWLTQLSYLNINKEGLTKVKHDGLYISKVSNYLSKPTAQMYGNVFGDKLEDTSKAVIDAYLGKKDGLITYSKLVQELIDSGLEEIKIIAIKNDPKTGFQAIAFEDSHSNKGISFRGSDCDWKNGGLADWLIADVGEFLTNSSKQSKQAIEFFDKYKGNNNYIYGHSLGGNLTAHTYLKRYKEITNAFSFNGLPINQNLLNTEDKIKAFTNPKFECVVVGGDIFQHLKDDTPYANKVKFIKNNEEGNQNWLSAHLPQSCTYDEKNNFITITRKEALDIFSKERKWFVDTLNKINTMFGNKSYEITNFINVIEAKIIDFRKKTHLGFETISERVNNLVNYLENKEDNNNDR